MMSLPWKALNSQSFYKSRESTVIRVPSYEVIRSPVKFRNLWINILTSRIKEAKNKEDTIVNHVLHLKNFTVNKIN